MKSINRSGRMLVLIIVCLLSFQLSCKAKQRVINYEKLPKYLKDEAQGKIDKTVIFETRSGRYQFVSFTRHKKTRKVSRIVVFELLKNKDALPNLIWSTKWTTNSDVKFQEVPEWQFKEKSVVLATKRLASGKLETDVFGFAGPEMRRIKTLSGSKIYLDKKGGDSPLLTIETAKSKKLSYTWQDETLKISED